MWYLLMNTLDLSQINFHHNKYVFLSQKKFEGDDASISKDKEWGSWLRAPPHRGCKWKEQVVEGGERRLVEEQRW